MKTYPVIWTLPAIASLRENESVMIVEVLDTRRDPSRLKVEPDLD